MLRLIRLATLALGPTLVLVMGVVSARAHPMGNFSINHYSDITVSGDAVRLLYIIDMAEIPTFQELTNLNVATISAFPPAQRTAYLASKAASLARGLTLQFNGRPLRLTLRADDLLFPPGAGGLPTERLYLVLQAPLPHTTGALSYEDANFPDRAGWKEIVARAAPGVALSQSSTTSTSRSEALSVYPTTATTSPPQDVSATLTVAAPLSAHRARDHTTRSSADAAPTDLIHQAEAPLFGPGGRWSVLAQRLAVKGQAVTRSPPARPSSWAQGRMDALTSLIAQRDLPAAGLGFSLLIAVVLGAFHAFSPGHGKSVVAAYIVGSRATAWHAVLLGLTVTVTHTAGVFVLGLVTLGLSRYIVPDHLYPWLGALSGAFIVTIGLSLALRRLSALRRSTGEHDHGHQHEHGSDATHVHLGDAHIGSLTAPLGHVAPPISAGAARLSQGAEAMAALASHQTPSRADAYAEKSGQGAAPPYGHGADAHHHGLFDRGHSHLPPAGQDVTLGSLLTLGVSGGLLPCPSALVVLLSAIALHRVAFGLLLIVAFSLGLASVLTGIGLLLAYARRLADRLPLDGAALRVLPVLSACAVALMGAAVTIESLASGGILRLG